MATAPPFTLSLTDLPAILRLATAAKALLLDADIAWARTHPFGVKDMVDRTLLVALADALDALRAP